MVAALVLPGRHVKHSLSPSAACAAILLGKHFSQGGLWSSSSKLADCTHHPSCTTSTHVESGYENLLSARSPYPAALAVVWGAGDNSRGASVHVQPPHAALTQRRWPCCFVLLWLTARSPALCPLCWRLGCRRWQQWHEGGRRAQVPNVCGSGFCLGACIPLLHDRLQADDVAGAGVKAACREHSGAQCPAAPQI